MAGNTNKDGGSNRQWTNERHQHFLNSMETSFVQSMFGVNGRQFPPLDRYLPDTSESTQDLAKERRRRFSDSDNVEESRRREKKSRNISSQDQVVPQFQNKRGDD